MHKLKAAVVGLGTQAMNDHVPGLREAQCAQLCGVCDIDEQKVARISEEEKVPGFTNLEKLVQETKPDFIIAALPHDAYREVVELCSSKGIHVLKEKPFARNMDEAEYFAALAETGGIEIMTTLQRRFNPIYSTFQQLRNYIGDIFSVNMEYSLFVESPGAAWRGQAKRAGGGCIVDMGYHMVDLLVWYFGVPKTVYATSSVLADPGEVYDAEDTAHIQFSYDNGIKGSMFLSRSDPPKREKTKVTGTTGTIEIEKGKIVRTLRNGTTAETLSREQGWPVASTVQIDYFSRVIKGEKPNLGDPSYHLQHIRFIEACYESIRRNEVVCVK